MMTHPQMVRLLAEAYAVLDQHDIRHMSASMDLPEDDIRKMFLENEREWEFLKDYLRRTGRNER
jgi:hypothetical protein